MTEQVPQGEVVFSALPPEDLGCTSRQERRKVLNIALRSDPFLLDPEEAVGLLLRSIVGSEVATQGGLVDTPTRVVKALREMTKGYAEDPEDILGKVFEEPCDEVIILRDIPFTSLCEHHLLPFVGTADVGYLPGSVVGLSKLARLVDCYACRLQMQERLTKEIAESLVQHLKARGAAVVTRAIHSCLACRGAKKAGAEMVCSSMLGVFRDKPEARAEFLALCGR